MKKSKNTHDYNPRVIYSMDHPKRLCYKCKINIRCGPTSSYCRECANEYKREHIKNNKDKYKKQWSQRYHNTKGDPEAKKKRSEYAKTSWENVKKDPLKHEKRKKKKREYASNRRKTQPWVRAKRSARKRISKAKDKQGIPKYERDLNFGCSISEFKSYIESLWQEEMSWDNYGKNSGQERYWELDHVKPLSSFNLTDVDEAERCGHYRNLQPLWSEDHKKKTKSEK